MKRVFLISTVLLQLGLLAGADSQGPVRNGLKDEWRCEIPAADFKLTGCALRPVPKAKNGQVALLNSDVGFVRNSRGFAEVVLDIPTNGKNSVRLPCKYLGPEDFADFRTEVELKAGDNELVFSVSRGGEIKIDTILIVAI